VGVAEGQDVREKKKGNLWILVVSLLLLLLMLLMLLQKE
jgi:uncharacterized integral membrane protein